MRSSLAVGLLVMLTAVSAADQPAHCSTTWDDWEHTTAGVKTHECYTYTKTRASELCPTYNAPTDIMCLMTVAVENLEVPCATDCCAETPTVYVDAPCPTSPTGCVFPTETITQTMGCAQTVPATITPKPTVW
ncbi:hypothetical protein PG994_000336 [Apiospora phragmitis]|uniref:Uncharacterized protein n=1 Tax=Apiospora phragmitis TaxID=2905665 RepID=A0ABR1X5X4_9PEZI